MLVELAKLLKCLKKVLTLAPIWLPHWPACRWTISLIMQTLDELGAGGELKAGGGELGGLEWPAGVPPADCPSCPSLHHIPCPCRPSRGLPCITTRLTLPCSSLFQPLQNPYRLQKAQQKILVVDVLFGGEFSWSIQWILSMP